MSDLTVVTCRGRIPRADEFWYCYPQWLLSLQRHGVNPLILTPEKEWGGLTFNALLPKQALDKGMIKTSHYLFANCFDVLFAAHPEQILETFLNIQQIGSGVPSIIFGAEKLCFPKTDLCERHPRTSFSYKYLNSGWHIGETEALHHALKEMNPESLGVDEQLPDGSWKHPEDQSAWQRQMIDGSVPIGLDGDVEMVINLHGVLPDELDLSGDKIRCTETGTYPMCFHMNGSSSATFKDKLVQKLGL